MAMPTRNVLNVPRIGFYHDTQRHADSRMRCPEDVPLPAVLRACLESMGDGLGCTRIGQISPHWQVGCGYALLMGLTGSAFRLSWKEGWHGDNVATWLIGSDAGEIFRRAYQAIGYEQIPVHVRPGCGEPEPPEQIVRKVVESIDAGRPVMAHGVVGPPEEAIIAGYDEGGDVILGWSFFQYGGPSSEGLEYEPNGMFRKRNWLADTWALTLFGRKLDPPRPEQAYLAALDWALKVMRTPRRFDRHNGIAAFDAWIAHLDRQSEIEADTDLAMEVHDDAVMVVAEGRWYASIFLTGAARHLPFRASPLLDAAARCADSHALMWDMWKLLGGHGRGPQNKARLLDAGVREQMKPILRAARQNDVATTECIEKALA